MSEHERRSTLIAIAARACDAWIIDPGDPLATDAVKRCPAIVDAILAALDSETVTILKTSEVGLSQDPVHVLIPTVDCAAHIPGAERLPGLIDVADILGRRNRDLVMWYEIESMCRYILGGGVGGVERDRMWCGALLPEGIDVVERVTTRFNDARAPLTSRAIGDDR